MSKTQSVVLDGRGYALVPLASADEARTLHAAGVTIRLESPTDSMHVDRQDTFQLNYDWFSKFHEAIPRLFAVFYPNLDNLVRYEEKT